MNWAGETVEAHALRRAFVFNRRLLTRKVNGGMRKIAHYAMIMQRFSPNSNQPTAVSRINVWAVSCGGFRPLMMAVVKVRWPFGGYGSGRVERRLRGPYGGDQSRRRGARAGRRAAPQPRRVSV